MNIVEFIEISVLEHLKWLIFFTLESNSSVSILDCHLFRLLSIGHCILHLIWAWSVSFEFYQQFSRVCSRFIYLHSGRCMVSQIKMYQLREITIHFQMDYLFESLPIADNILRSTAPKYWFASFSLFMCATFKLKYLRHLWDNNFLRFIE